MTDKLLLLCTIIIIYEFIKFIKFIDIIKSNLKVYKKMIKLFAYKKASDQRKEELIFNYSKLLIFFSFKIFSIVILIFLFIILVNQLSNSFLNFVISIYGIIEMTLVLIFYHMFRKKLNG